MTKRTCTAAMSPIEEQQRLDEQYRQHERARQLGVIGWLDATRNTLQPPQIYDLLTHPQGHVPKDRYPETCRMLHHHRQIWAKSAVSVEKKTDQLPQETAEEEADREEVEDWTRRGWELYCKGNVWAQGRDFDRLEKEIKALKGPVAEARRARIEGRIRVLEERIEKSRQHTAGAEALLERGKEAEESDLKSGLHTPRRQLSEAAALIEDKYMGEEMAHGEDKELESVVARGKRLCQARKAKFEQLDRDIEHTDRMMVAMMIIHTLKRVIELLEAILAYLT